MSPRFATKGLAGGRASATVFRDVDLAVDAGRILALLGPNGAGKTTLLLTVAGLLKPHGGTTEIDGAPLRAHRPALANKAGVVLVPDNRSLFAGLSVEETLRVAARRGGPEPRDMLDVFPTLEMRWNVRAGALSGGEQQMLAMARALVQQPKVLLVDELSMGLAPLVVASLFEAVQRIAADVGCAVVLVEQHVGLALQVADRAAVLNHGRVVLACDAAAIREHPDRMEDAYFGTHTVATGPND